MHLASFHVWPTLSPKSLLPAGATVRGAGHTIWLWHQRPAGPDYEISFRAAGPGPGPGGRPPPAPVSWRLERGAAEPRTAAAHPCLACAALWKSGRRHHRSSSAAQFPERQLALVPIHLVAGLCPRESTQASPPIHMRENRGLHSSVCFLCRVYCGRICCRTAGTTAGIMLSVLARQLHDALVLVQAPPAVAFPVGERVCWTLATY